MSNPGLEQLHAYPFQKLNALLAEHPAPADTDVISLSIGEPRHAAPDFVLTTLTDTLARSVGSYPASRGLPELRAACADWATRRYGLEAGSLDPERMLLPVAGTREALFAVAQTFIDPAANATVLMPNPFYQIYEGAALLAGASPVYLNLTPENGYLPDLDSVSSDEWQRCRLMYLCSPHNPTGTVLPADYLQRVLELADEHNFIVASDECYSEIYLDEGAPPVGLLDVARRTGRRDFAGCLVFQSLSKRSNLPGLRSGFVAGDPALIARFAAYRSYQGCALPVGTQLASIAAWNDDAHVGENREIYRNKFQEVTPVLSGTFSLTEPDGGFYYWLDVGGDDIAFTAALHAKAGVVVLPGSYLAREHAGLNPGSGHVRVSLVAEPHKCIEAAERICEFSARF